MTSLHSVLKATATVATVAVGIVNASTANAKADALTARALIRLALDAQGGEQALRSISLVDYRATGYRNMVEQSERPTGPFTPEFRSVHEIHDFSHGSFATVVERHPTPDTSFTTGTIADPTAAVRVLQKQKLPGSVDLLLGARDQLALSPERLLLTALDAHDLGHLTSAVVQSIPQDVVSFSLNKSPVTLYLNRYTHLPTAVDYEGPAARDGYWPMLGDVRMRTYFTNWALGDGAVRLPLQLDVFRNGLHDSTMVTSSILLNGKGDDDMLVIAPALRAAFAKVATGPANAPVLQPSTKVQEGVAFFPGPWNVALIRQSDGIVILEAPISSAYSEQIIAAAKKLFPDTRIKAVVSTSDSWPHIAGLRPYIARQIPIYCLDVTEPLLQRLAKSTFRYKPDALQRHWVPANFIPVHGKTVIGAGPNQMDIYPIRGEASERQLMVYFPRSHLLYGSDPFQPAANGRFQSDQAVTELMDAVKREGLQPHTFFMMHVPPTDWSKAESSVAASALRFPSSTSQ